MQTYNFLFKSYRDNINTIDGIIEASESLNQEIENTDLSGLSSFNKTFIIILKNIKKKALSGAFIEFSQIEYFFVRSADYYFYSLKNYVTGLKCSRPWKIFFDKCKKSTSPSFINLILGMNAHINSDYIYTLNDVHKDGSFLTDYEKVNDIISESINEIVLQTADKDIIENDYSKKTNISYSLFFNIIVKRWRAEAWKNYLNYKKKLIGEKDIESSAENTAMNICHITHFSNLWEVLKLPKIKIFNNSIRSSQVS
ncbi:MAG: DUF5995 family protein [bacterium]